MEARPAPPPQGADQALHVVRLGTGLRVLSRADRVTWATFPVSQFHDPPRGPVLPCVKVPPVPQVGHAVVLPYLVTARAPSSRTPRRDTCTCRTCRSWRRRAGSCRLNEHLHLRPCRPLPLPRDGDSHVPGPLLHAVPGVDRPRVADSEAAHGLPGLAQDLDRHRALLCHHHHALGLPRSALNLMLSQDFLGAHSSTWRTKRSPRGPPRSRGPSASPCTRRQTCPCSTRASGHERGGEGGRGAESASATRDSRRAGGLYKGRTLNPGGVRAATGGQGHLMALFTTFVERVEFRSLKHRGSRATAGGARDALGARRGGRLSHRPAAAVPGNRLSLTELLFRPTSATSRRTATATSVLGFFIFVSLCGEQRVPLFSLARSGTVGAAHAVSCIPPMPRVRSSLPSRKPKLSTGLSPAHRPKRHAAARAKDHDQFCQNSRFANWTPICELQHSERVERW